MFLVSIAAAISSLLVFGAAHADNDSTPAAAQSAPFVSPTHQMPDGFRVLGPISAHVCAKSGEPSPTDADAIEALRARAKQLGADGVIDVKFYRRQPGPAPRSSLLEPCWQMTQASGDAVVRSSAP
jgi:hypothetical protein